MLSYVFMKILEMRPKSYDRRIDRFSGGRVGLAKASVAKAVPPGSRALEIGCGTGELAAMLVRKGCRVDGFDLSPSMVATARRRIETDGLSGRFSVWEMGVDGMDGLAGAAYDAVVSTLVFSELSGDERRYALKHAARALKPGGLLVIADETVPETFFARMVHALLRLPLAAAAYLVTGRTTRPLADMAGEIAEAGFSVESEERRHRGTLAIVTGRLPGG